jgi:hypothetical protein
MRLHRIDQAFHFREQRSNMRGVRSQISFADPRGGTGMKQGSSLGCLQPHGHVIAKS